MQLGSFRIEIQKGRISLYEDGVLNTSGVKKMKYIFTLLERTRVVSFQKAAKTAQRIGELPDVFRANML
jgi:hypothetical protein